MAKRVKMERVCSTCRLRKPRKGQRTCAECHAIYMADWRKGKVLVPREAIPRETLFALSARGKKAKQRLAISETDHEQDHDQEQEANP